MIVKPPTTSALSTVTEFAEEDNPVYSQEHNTDLPDLLSPTEDVPEGIAIYIEDEDGNQTLVAGEEEPDHEEIPFDANLAEYLDDSELSSLASELIADIEADMTARSQWVDTLAEGLENVGFKIEERSEPWEGASGVYSTLLAEAVIRFQAETMSETFPAAGPVRTKVLGKPSKETDLAALRVQEDMNFQVLERMVEYRSEHERLLYNLGLAGSAFKKIYFDPTLDRPVSVFVPAEDMIVPYGASHLDNAERVTHVMRKTKNELERLQAQGFYVQYELDDPAPFFTDIEEKKAEQAGHTLLDDSRYTLFEVHATISIPDVDDEEDTLAKPYVITVDRSSNRILAIRRNWEEDDTLYRKRNHFVHYTYVPGYGFYGLGLVHIIGGYARATTALTRQLIDAGTLSNLPGGLKTKGLRVKGDDTPISPGEFRDVDVPSGAIRDNIMTLPYKEPSPTLLNMLQMLNDEGRRLGAISDMNVADMSANAPVGTTLALLERALKPMAAVQSRVHAAMKQEFKLLKRIMADTAPEDIQYAEGDAIVQASQRDYSLVDVIPVSDPNSTTMAQRVVQYQAVFQMAQAAPQIYDLPQLHRQMVEVLGIKNVEKLIPTSEDQTPKDPVSENMAILVGKPVKAFIHQDHEAHMQAHQSFLQDPSIMAAVGQSPMAAQMMAAAQAHIAEHLSFKYRKDIETKLGVALPPPGQDLPEDVEQLLSQTIADAAIQLAQQNQQQAAAAQAQQAQQDPVFQLEQMKAQARQTEVQAKAQKMQADTVLAQQKQAFEEQQAQQQLALQEKKLMLETMKDEMKFDSASVSEDKRTQLELLRLNTQRGQNG